MANFSSKMKASYRRNTRFAIVVRVLMVLAVVLAVLIFFGRLVSNLGAVVSYPLYATRNWVLHSSAVLPSYIRSRGELIDQITSLQSEIASRSGMDLTLARLTEENEELKNVLSVKEADVLSASVIARPPFLPYDSVLIDRGSDDGVIEGATIFYARDAVIGYVSKVFPKSALVTLFSNPGTRASVYVTGPNIFATAEGQGGGVIRVGIPQGLSVLPGSVVLMPILGGGVVGEVQYVDSVPTEPEQHAFVVPDIPIQSLRLVTVRADAVPTLTYEEASAVIDQLRRDQFVIADIPPGASATSSVSTTTEEGGTTGSTSDMIP